MKKNREKENNTMDQSDFISDPFLDSLKKKVDESLESENITVSEDLIRSTLRAIEIKKETVFHENNSVAAKEKIAGAKEEKQPVSIDELKEEKQKKQDKNKRKVIKYIGTWGTVVAASIIICYLGSQSLFSYFIEGKFASKKDSGSGASNTSSETSFDSIYMEDASPKSPEQAANEAAVLENEASDEKQSLPEELRKDFTADDLKDGTEEQGIGAEGKTTVTVQDALVSDADMVKDKQENGANPNSDGVSKKAYDYAMEDIDTWADDGTKYVHLDGSEEEKSKSIMLLMASEHLHLTTEEPALAITNIICISLSEEDVIVYILNNTEALIKTYGKEGIVTSTSYEVDKGYDLIQGIERIIN